MFLLIPAAVHPWVQPVAGLEAEAEPAPTLPAEITDYVWKMKGNFITHWVTEPAVPLPQMA